MTLLNKSPYRVQKISLVQTVYAGSSAYSDGAARLPHLSILHTQFLPYTLADFYVSATTRSGGAAAEQAAGRKTAKYDLLAQTGRLFQPIAAETAAR